jgi:hypothetical protein
MSALWPKTVSDNGVQIAFGGTILLFYADRKQVFVAADSRFASNGLAPPIDRGCKIISLSDSMIFFYSGGIAEIRKNNQIIFSAYEVARHAFKQTNRESHPFSRLTEMARIWGTAMKPTTDEILKITPKNELPNEVQLGGFAGLDDHGIPRLMLANLSITVFDDGRPIESRYDIYEWPTDINAPLGFGGTPAYEGAIEFLQATTQRAKHASVVFENSYKNKHRADYQLYQ